MQVELRHNPSFTVARCVLAGNEAVRVEGGAMIAHSAGVVLEAKAQGGVMAGLKRSVLGGGSFFVTTYTAPGQGGWVDVAGVLPGDVVSIEVTPDRPFFLRRGSWIANSAGVDSSGQTIPTRDLHARVPVAGSVPRTDTSPASRSMTMYPKGLPASQPSWASSDAIASR